MLKRILTLFAILTGLAAVAAPAQAQFAAVENIGAQAASEAGSKCADKRTEELAQPLTGQADHKSQAPAACRPPVITIVIPTVMLQADRAWE